MLSVAVNRRHYGAGKLVRLTAPGGLGATGGAVIGGVSYGQEGVQPLGAPLGERIESRVDGVTGNAVYQVYLPPGSAALLILTPGG